MSTPDDRPGSFTRGLPFDIAAIEFLGGPRDEKVHHRARWAGSYYLTQCGKRFGGLKHTDPRWADWGAGGPFEPWEFPAVTCERCGVSPEPMTPAEMYAELQRLREIGEPGDAEARQEIAAALPRGWLSDDDRRRIAAAVWPVVERIRERARAEGAADALAEDA
jgi:hypothetical protein